MGFYSEAGEPRARSTEFRSPFGYYERFTRRLFRKPGKFGGMCAYFSSSLLSQSGFERGGRMPG